MARALITGGAGFIGSHLAETLLERGYSVTLIDNLSTGYLENVAHLSDRAQIVIETIMNEAVMDRLVSECDVIFHLAAAVGVFEVVNKPIHTIETNVRGTEIVLKTARRYRKKVMLASTSEVYGNGIRTPFSEDDDRLLGPTTKSRWGYASSKALDEFLGLAYHKEVGLPVVVFRLFNTVGPRQRGRYGMVVPRFVQWALQGKPLQVYGDGQQSRCFANVSDVVDAICGLSESEEAVGEVFNIGTQEETTIHALAERVIARTDSPSEIRLVPYAEAYEEGFDDMRRRVPDINKIKGAIGWQPRKTLDETLDEIVAYFLNGRMQDDTAGEN
ncbi:MAG: NAD-dependent epimerase/dehydratase family protein [Chloroflexi bacterium]|nr:NAD-dependent epimerase/dehydratase family protein [Chloroflexota bacterium]